MCEYAQANQWSVRELTSSDNIGSLCKLVNGYSPSRLHKCCFKSVFAVRCQWFLIASASFTGTYFFGAKNVTELGVTVCVALYVVCCFVLKQVFKLNHRQTRKQQSIKLVEHRRRHLSGDTNSKLWIATVPGQDNAEEIVGCVGIRKPISRDVANHLNNTLHTVELIHMRILSEYSGTNITTQLYDKLMHHVRTQCKAESLAVCISPLLIDFMDPFFSQRGFQVVGEQKTYHFLSLHVIHKEYWKLKLSI